MDLSCRDRVAVVTGAAGSGIGRSIALTLAREGAKVVVNYRTSREMAQRIVEHIGSEGGQALAVQADVFDETGCRELVESSTAHFGRIDICVFNPGGEWLAGESLSNLNPSKVLEDVRRELAPLLYMLPLILPGMYERKYGRLIALGLLPPYIAAGSYGYGLGKAARKHAMLLSLEQAWRNGVTLNVIAPGPIPQIESLKSATELCEHGPSWHDRSRATPQDIAEGVAFLCSEAGRYVSGCELFFQFHG